MPTKTVHDAYIRTKLPALHRTLIEIVDVMNRLERNEAMLKATGLTLERALFPLLVLVERPRPHHGQPPDRTAGGTGAGHPLRQHGGPPVREATITPQGKEATDTIDCARPWPSHFSRTGARPISTSSSASSECSPKAWRTFPPKAPQRAQGSP